jgi:hypothetical protein
MQNKHLISWLRLTVFLLFIGRAWQHISWSGPYGNLFYSERYLGKLIEFTTGLNRHEYLSSTGVSDFLANVNFVFGIVFLVAAFCVLLVNKRKSYYKATMKIGWYLLFIVAFGYFAEKNHTWGQLLEYSAQLITPYLLLMAVKYKMKKKFVFIAKLAIAITFICHGLYAFGYYPVPGAFIDMMIKGFGMNEPQAVYWLRVFGVVDFAFAIGIFIPYVSRYFLLYGLIWGFLTAFARIYTQVNLDFLEANLSQYTHEFLVRIPHFIIPLLLLKYKKEIII